MAEASKQPNKENSAVIKPCLRPESDTAGCLRSYLPPSAAGLKPAERGPGGGLTATYCTPLGRIWKTHPLPREMLIFIWQVRLLGSLLEPPGGLLGASWRPLGGVLEASWGLLGRLGALLGASWASWGRLGSVLGPSWRFLGPSWGLLEASWRQLGGNLAEDGQQDEAKLT